MRIFIYHQPVAPATGTPETGGWSTRELRTILRGLEGINLIAADIVEVAVSLGGVASLLQCTRGQDC
jgi:arginase family enzyme